MSGLPVTDLVLIVDFGGQFTQLIARRVREANVYSEIVPYTAAEKAVAELRPKAIILSGGPSSVLDPDAPQVPDAIFEAGVPVLGICYGQQGMVHRLGGQVQPGERARIWLGADRDRGRARRCSRAWAGRAIRCRCG